MGLFDSLFGRAERERLLREAVAVKGNLVAGASAAVALAANG